MSRLCLVDLETQQVHIQDGYRLTGACTRCGECCREIACPALIYETVDGVRLAACAVYHRRPWKCAIWPTRDDTIPAGCGYTWIKE